MSTVLLVKMSSLGDVIHALPAVTDAARQGYTFHWVVEEAFADIARAHPAVTRVMPIAWRRWRRELPGGFKALGAFRDALRSEAYTRILDSQGLLKSAVVARMAKRTAEGRIAGYDADSAREPLAARCYHERHFEPDTCHAVERQRRLFAKALNYTLPKTPADFGLPSVPPAEGRLCVLLHGTTWENKHWPEAMWLRLAEMLVRQGFRVAVTWGDAVERQRAERIAKAGKGIVWPKATLGDVMTRLGSATLVIGVDSGLTHLAAALGVPTVGMYGPTDARLTGALGPRAVALSAEFACAPCRVRTCRYSGPAMAWGGRSVAPACFASLNPDMVLDRALQLLS